MIKKTGIIVSCWDSLRRDEAALEVLIQKHRDDAGVIILSREPTAASPAILRDRLPRSFVTDTRLLSPARLKRLCDGASPDPIIPRFGLVVSNGFGLGHVMRMKAVAAGLQKYAPCLFMSFSAALWQNTFHLASPQYLELHKTEGNAYVREATLRFITTVAPTHLIYDGNVLPEGMLAALAAHPEIHLTWIRRGMWQPDTATRLMAQQAMADLVIEPGDLAESLDTGPSWNNRFDYCPPGAFLKIPPIRPQKPTYDRNAALNALGLDPAKHYALVMFGACQTAEDRFALRQAVAALRRRADVAPVVAHWPMAHDAPPNIDGVPVIEQMPIAPYYKGFDFVVSAAGYNSFHEILTAGLKVIFMPQEDEGRDQQLARAQFAAERRLGLLCRRSELHNLQFLTPPVPAPLKSEWLEDWSLVANAMGKNFVSVSSQRTMVKGTPRAFGAIFRHWKRRAKTWNMQFLLAFDMDFAHFQQCAGKTQGIVVTNSIDPIALRRAGYKYLWLNPMDARGMHRQFLRWLNIWKPAQMINLSASPLTRLLKRTA